MAVKNKARIIRDAEKYVTQGKIRQAISEYQKIVKSDPKDVLVLNTIGDLYLRQGKVRDANKYFSQAAENYVRNSFFSQAIAIYKKILNTDPNNRETNLALASLYAKQGLNVDARSQYMRIAEQLIKQGKIRDSLEPYEKAVELDPKGSAIQRKLAEMLLAEKLKQKAHFHFVGAARSLFKAGDLTGAADSFKQAIQINASDAGVTKEFLECAVQLGDVAPALGLLRESLGIDSNNAAMTKLADIYQETDDESGYLEMLGRIAKCYLDRQDPDTALEFIEKVLQLDPQSDKYQRLYRQAFAEVHPEAPGAPPPAGTADLQTEESLAAKSAETVRAEGLPHTVEVDRPSRELADIQPDQAPAADQKTIFPEAPIRTSDATGEAEASTEVDLSKDFLEMFHEEKTGEAAPADTGAPEEKDVFAELKIDKAFDRFAQSYSEDRHLRHETKSESSPIPGAGTGTEYPLDQLPPPDSVDSNSVKTDTQVNPQLADLIQELDSLADHKNKQKDFMTHYDRGVAFYEKEMVEKAINEFQYALRVFDPAVNLTEFVQCCIMLSSCLIEKGMSHPAVRCCQMGLEVADISAQEALALRYYLGVAYSLAGRNDLALECFNHVFESDPDFRDVTQKIKELKGSSERHVP